MNSEIQFLLDTDVIVEYLNYKGDKLSSSLIKILSQGKCFTTVLNASELYFFAKDKLQLEAVEKFLFSINVLGIHSRYSLKISEYSKHFNNLRDCLIYVVAYLNKLSIVTKRNNVFPEGDVNIIVI
ncbi:MAG: PIN domain-containing protein [Ignavibacterium sp.]|nr:PIN domain-containing protein [Ignavibacterium sp.]MDW8375216.1 PIN domain-containing protein [Ignavibacteriales bacterium]